MEPYDVGMRMVKAIPKGAYPLALVTLTLTGDNVTVLVPQVYQRMLQDPKKRAEIVDIFTEQLALFGKHPEDWNGKVRVL